jgi:hypothetical protein
MVKVELLRPPEIASPEVAVGEDARWGYLYVLLKAVYPIDIGVVEEVVLEVGLDRQFRSSSDLNALKELLDALITKLWRDSSLRIDGEK